MSDLVSHMVLTRTAACARLSAGAKHTPLHTCNNQQGLFVVSHCCLALLRIQSGEACGLQVCPPQRLQLLLLLALLLLLLLTGLPVFASSMSCCPGAVVSVA
jgi:hypothetical protein